MPEGDTIHHAATRIRSVLEQRVPQEILTPQPRHRHDRWPERLGGRAVSTVDAHGKHLFLRFEGDLTIHSHLRMTGSWRVLDDRPRPRTAWLAIRRGAQEVVQTHPGTYTYDELIRDGRPCTVEVSAVFPLGQLTQAGLPASGVILQVHRDDTAPYQAQVGLHIPDELASVVVPGARLPGKWLPGPGLATDVNLVTIDFPALRG